MQVFQVERPYAGHREMAFSPDGRFLAINLRVLTFLDTVGGSPRTFPELGDVFEFAFIRNGAELVYTSSDDVIHVVHLDSGKQHRVSLEDATPGALAVAPNADAVFVWVYYYSNRRSDIRSLHIANMKQQVSFAAMNKVVDRLAISADGRWLATLSETRVLRVWHVGGPKLPSRAKLHVETRSVFLGDFALSADGSRLVAVDCQGLYIWNTATGEHLHSGKHRRGVTAVACSPTKPIFVTGDNAGQVFLWDYTGGVLTRYDWKLKRVSSLAFAPDGLRCAAVDARGKVVVWDVDV
ncbi:MAG: WD40 repeat domain-containing protein [Planctomycetia bacterium]|nr:WD40 repeat domain-containing protein [Planctomycetia bacterium]